MQMEKNTILPPPPPLPSLPLSIKINISNEYSLPSPQEEVSKTCQQLWNYVTGGKAESFVLSVYHQIKPVIQDGPKCGLVALCMASQLFSQVLTVDETFDRAKVLGFTNLGEMFSVDSMNKLAKDLLQCQADIITDLTNKQDIILSHLLNGLPMLVPYDADGNHEPCCKSGHTAHWAVITGFCVVLNKSKYRYDFIGIQDSKIPHLYHWKGNILPFTVDDEPVYVFARHGKSNKLGLWNFNSLCESNANLKELATKHIVNDFVLPKSGIYNELANHALLLH